MKEKILVIDDDRDLQFALRTFFLDNNFVVDQVFDGASGLKEVETQPDIVVLDLGLPDIDGESVCRIIKRGYPQLPVIVLTAKNTTADAVNSLSLGADDFIPKPFDLEELLARVKTRLNKISLQEKVVISDLEMNLKTCEVFRGGSKVNLTPTEFKLLEYLMENKDRVLTRETILNHVWSYNFEVESRVVDVYIGYLRRKVDRNGKVKLIHNIRGFGYTIKQS